MIDLFYCFLQKIFLKWKEKIWFYGIVILFYWENFLRLELKKDFYLIFYNKSKLKLFRRNEV